MENTIKNTSDDKHKIVEKYFDMIYKLALSQAKDSYVAEDVTADVFLKYIESSKAFKSEEHIKAWLVRVTINRVKSVFTVTLSNGETESAIVYSDTKTI